MRSVNFATYAIVAKLNRAERRIAPIHENDSLMVSYES